MEHYLTICCDSRPISIKEEGQGAVWFGSNNNFSVIIIGLCPNCQDWYECYVDEENEDWADELEYINNHLEEN